MSEAAPYRRAHVGVVLALIVPALGLAALAMTGRAPRDLWEWLHAAPEDGSWAATTLDGRAVGAGDYLVSISRGKVVGGYDGCNGWSYQDEAPDGKGERMIVSTLQACPRERPDQSYWFLVHQPEVRMLGDGQLQLWRAGHHGLFRRCRPHPAHARCLPE